MYIIHSINEFSHQRHSQPSATLAMLQQYEMKRRIIITKICARFNQRENAFSRKLNIQIPTLKLQGMEHSCRFG